MGKKAIIAAIVVGTIILIAGVIVGWWVIPDQVTEEIGQVCLSYFKKRTNPYIITASSVIILAFNNASYKTIFTIFIQYSH